MISASSVYVCVPWVSALTYIHNNNIIYYGPIFTLYDKVSPYMHGIMDMSDYHVVSAPNVSDLS